MTKQSKSHAYIFILLVLAAVFSGCKSTPDPVEEPIIPEKTEAEKNAENLFDEISKIRMQVLDVKGDTQFPELFQTADSTAAEAKNAYTEKNFPDAEKYAQTALIQYRTLLNLVQIAALKAKINTHALQDYDAENYRKAEELTDQVTALYAQDAEAAYRISQEALQCYESVTNTGFSALMKDAKQKAEEAKERCDSIKASASMKDAYMQEVNRCRYAAIAADNKKYEQAYTGYITAAKEFNKIYETVKIKRAAALEAMEKAKARQEASSKLAENADKEAPLPENAEGFSNDPIEVAPIKRLNTPEAAVPADNPQTEPQAEPKPAPQPETMPAAQQLDAPETTATTTPEDNQQTEPQAEPKPAAQPETMPAAQQLDAPETTAITTPEDNQQTEPQAEPKPAAQPETMPAEGGNQ